MSKFQKAADKLRDGKKHVPGFRDHGLQVLFILLQVGIIALWLFISQKYIAHFFMLCEFLSLFVVLHIVREDKNSSYKIPWIIVNLTLPVLGALSYLMFGRVRFSKKETKRISNIQFKYSKVKTERNDASAEFERVNPHLARQASYIRNVAAAPIFTNTAVEYYPSGEAMFPRMLEELEKAEKFIFMEYFIVHPGHMWNSIEEVLARKAAAGVDVRVMYDSIGSFGLVPTDFVEQLKKKGIQACEFNKLTNIFSSRFNNRDHRKICVIDGNVGFTGGVNLADEYINRIERFGYWKDTAIMLKGDGVCSFTMTFLEMWEFNVKSVSDYREFLPTLSVEAPGYVQPYSDMPLDSDTVGEHVYRNILSCAKDYVYITTPYLIIDDEMINALTVAAKSGVDVRLVTPGIPDKKVAYSLTRSYYEVLLKAGVRVYEYSPGFMHAKMFVSDDKCAVVGTINLDYRSLCHHFENAVWMCDVPVVADIKADILECYAKSREITLEMCYNKSLIKRIGLSFLRILAPLF